MTREKLFRKLISSVSEKDLIKKSFEILKKAFQGEAEILHSLRVALIMSEMKLGSDTISAALLHDILDDKPDSLRKKELEEVSKMTNSEISFLVEKCFAVQRIRLPFPAIEFAKRKELKVENLRKMFLALAKDLRVLLITLASRLDHLRNLENVSAQEKKMYSFEIFEIFIPVAERLGIWRMKSEMEDLSFSYLYPKEFEWISKSIKEKYAGREKYLEQFKPILKSTLKKQGVKILKITSRTKTYWSSWQKLLKNRMNFEKVYDLTGIQIILRDIKECYRTLGILHQNWTPVSERVKDFIANPKPNGYRALHTTLITKDEKLVEIQIKTSQMQKESDFGICAHWAYKEKISLKKKPKLFNLLPFLKKKSKDEAFKGFRIDFFEKRVFVFTPDGEVISLSKGSTPVDFAYAVHTDIGNYCGGAKIDGKISLLSKTLENGDTVEILIDKKRIPSKDWLRFVKTNLAKNQIKKWFALPSKVSETRRKHKESKHLIKPGKSKEKYQITLAGQKGILMSMAKCCNPQSRDKIGAYITKDKGAIVHKINCKNFIRLAEKFPSKTIEACWIKPLSLKILAKDRIGLLKDISSEVSKLGMNILECQNKPPLDKIGVMELKIEAFDFRNLKKLFDKIKEIEGVVEVKEV